MKTFKWHDAWKEKPSLDLIKENSKLARAMASQIMNRKD